MSPLLMVLSAFAGVALLSGAFAAQSARRRRRAARRRALRASGKLPPLDAVAAGSHGSPRHDRDSLASPSPRD